MYVQGVLAVSLMYEWACFVDSMATDQVKARTFEFGGQEFICLYAYQPDPDNDTEDPGLQVKAFGLTSKGHHSFTYASVQQWLAEEKQVWQEGRWHRSSAGS